MPIGIKAIINKTDRAIYEINFEETKEEPYIELKISPSDIEYGIIHIVKETKGFFLGYRKQFVLETDTKPFVMHLTSASDGTKIGEGTGGYLCHPRPDEIDMHLLKYAPDTKDRIEGSFKRWYDSHSEVSRGTWIKIYRKHSKLYILEL